MAQAPAQDLGALTRGFFQLSNSQKLGYLLALAALAAVVVVAWMWLGTPAHRVLYSNLSDRDGGDVIAALAAQNVPYQVAQGGSAILVPGDRVYELRLQLAAQGLPRGGAVGFELMDTQRFGISQFAEQVNYQRALAGELARTVQSIASVQQARVHLAIPRASVFVRESPLPSASVLVAMYPGRMLDAAQVGAIQHLVASSVPELPARNVTVVDQAGNLMSAVAAGGTAPTGLDAGQLKYLHAVEQSYATRIENILGALVGRENVRAQVTATLDFTEVNQTSETFAPNGTPPQAAIRSQQTVETTSVAPQGPSGVPGALSNQPPGAASAPLTTPAPAPAQGQPAAAQNTHRENVVNYELDKTIRHTRGEVGAVRRLSAAVVVNYRRELAVDGTSSARALSEPELAQVNALAREAMGFSQERGDTLNVVNAPFSGEPVVGVEAPSPWAGVLDRLLSPSGVMTIGKYLLLAVVVLLALRMARSALRDLARAGAAARAARVEPSLAAAGYAPTLPPASYDADLQAVKDMARQEPRIVANVVKDWVGRGE